MSALLRVDGAVAIPFQAIGDDEVTPAEGPILVGLSRWEREREQFLVRKAPVGVRIPNTADVASIDEAILGAGLLLIEFPSFGDGRGYSQARLLRDARGYRGELRATGAAVVRDQLLGMVRCGIDSFELRADQSAELCMQALQDFSVAYQPARDTLPQVRALRVGTTRN